MDARMRGVRAAFYDGWLSLQTTTRVRNGNIAGVARDESEVEQGAEGVREVW